MDRSWQFTDHDKIIDSRNILSHMDDMEAEHWDESTEAAKPMYLWPADRREEYRAYEDMLAEIREQSGDKDLSVNGDAVILIREDQFTWWIRQEVEDTYGGDLYAAKKPFGEPERLTWSEIMDRFPFDHIDWEAAAEDQRAHYGELTFGKHTYLFATE